MQGKQEGGGPQGSGPWASLPFLPLGSERWVSRKRSRRSASLAPSTSGKLVRWWGGLSGSVCGGESLILGQRCQGQWERRVSDTRPAWK